MRQILTSVYLFVLSCAVQLFFSFWAVAAEQIVFSAGAPLGSFQGRVIVPLLTEAFKRNGIDFQAVYHPSSRSLLYSNSGVVDGELHRVYEFHEVTGGEYPNLIRIESKLLSIWLAVFSANDKELNSWEDLQGYTVVYYRGRKNVERALKKVLPAALIAEAVTDEQAFLMLARERVEFAISESREGNRIISGDERFSKIKEVAKLEETEIYAYINIKYQDLAPHLARTLEEMKRDGTFDAIYKRAGAE